MWDCLNKKIYINKKKQSIKQNRFNQNSNCWTKYSLVENLLFWSWSMIKITLYQSKRCQTRREEEWKDQRQTTSPIPRSTGNDYEIKKLVRLLSNYTMQQCIVPFQKLIYHVWFFLRVLVRQRNLITIISVSFCFQVYLLKARALCLKWIFKTCLLLYIIIYYQHCENKQSHIFYQPYEHFYKW